MIQFFSIAFFSFHIFSATPRFITSSLDTITLAFHVPAMKNAPYALEIWSNTTKRWQNTRCRTSTVKDSCILTNLTTSITVTDLSPGRTYFVRFTSSRQWRSEVSQAMKTKKLGNYAFDYMPKPGKSECSDWFFIGRDLQYGSFPRNRSQPYIIALEQSRRIQNLRPK